MGVYPMLLDETCFFLAADFDKAAWQDDAAAFLETCRLMSLPVALERSRSGKGGHIWFFFDEAVPATLARKLGAYILTETMERRPDIGLDSYDRFFPNQDTLPQGGFGNLIALPLQKRRRELGNSIFLDERFTPFPDQWEFLSSIRRINRSEVEERVRLAEAEGASYWRASSAPETKKTIQRPGWLRLRDAGKKLQSLVHFRKPWISHWAIRSILRKRRCPPPFATD